MRYKVLGRTIHLRPACVNRPHSKDGILAAWSGRRCEAGGNHDRPASPAHTHACEGTGALGWGRLRRSALALVSSGEGCTTSLADAGCGLGDPDGRVMPVVD